MKYSSQNRITIDMILQTRSATSANRGFCKGAWGTQSDWQCMGYNRLCALAALLDTGDSYKAVSDAIKEADSSPYSKGFQDGWDRKLPDKPDDAEYALGYADGREISYHFRWERNTSREGAFR